MFGKPSVKNRVSTKSRVLALSIVLAWICGQYSTYVDYPAMLVASVALSRAVTAQTLAMTSTHNSIETKSINLKSDGLRSEKRHTFQISKCLCLLQLLHALPSIIVFYSDCDLARFGHMQLV